MAETIRDVVIRMQIKQVGDKIKPPKLGPVKKQVDDIDKSVVKLNKDTKQLASTNIELFDSLGQVGEGMLKVGRGMTLLGISADDDLRKVVEQLARMQGALDIFTGGVQAVKGMVAAQKALAAATSATAAAQVTLTAAAAPYIAAAAVVAGAIGGIVALTVDWGEAVDDTGDKSKEANDKIIRSLQRRLGLQKELLGIQERAADAVNKFGTQEQKLSAAKERQQKASAELTGARGRLSAAQQDQRVRAALDPSGKTPSRLSKAERLPFLQTIAQETEKQKRAAEEQFDLERRGREKNIAAREKTAARARALRAAANAEQAAFESLAVEGQEGESHAQFIARKQPGFGAAAKAAEAFSEGGQNIGQVLAALDRAVASNEKKNQQIFEAFDRLNKQDIEADRKLASLLHNLSE